MNTMRNVAGALLQTFMYNPKASLETKIGNSIIQSLVGRAVAPLFVVLHEGGHAIAAELLYENANSKIKFNSYGYGGARTGYCDQVLSKIGRWLGKSNAEAIIFAAGPVTEMLTYAVLMRSFSMNGLVFSVMLDNTFCALDALSDKAPFEVASDSSRDENDFVGLKINGGFAAEALVITSLALQVFSIGQCFV